MHQPAGERMCACMTSAIPRSPTKPSASARAVANEAGQLSTIFSIALSRSKRTRAAHSGPASCSSAASASATLTVMPGAFSVRFQPHASAGNSMARISASTARSGDAIHIFASGCNGHTAASPFSGSRRILLMNPDAARLGLPGRTTIVGSRTQRPST